MGGGILMFIIIEEKTLIDDSFGKRNIPLNDVMYCCDSLYTAKKILEKIRTTCGYKSIYVTDNILEVKDNKRAIWRILYKIKIVDLYGSDYNDKVYNLRMYNPGDITIVDTPYKYVDLGWFSTIEDTKESPAYREFLSNSQKNKEIELIVEDTKLIPISKNERNIFPFLSIVEFKIYKRILLQ